MSYYISQAVAKALDEELFKMVGVVQLMEVAGLTVAQVAYNSMLGRVDSALVLCGPGNNGGDGLVAAKYLKVFGCESVDFCVERRESNLSLVQQALEYDCVFLERVENFGKYSLIVDAIFGFGYKKRVGEQNLLLDKFVEYSHLKGREGVILSIDVPSGWDVNEEGVQIGCLDPDCIVSLTAPKLCTKKFTKAHYLGGRFVPDSLLEKYNLSVLKKLYKSHELFVRI